MEEKDLETSSGNIFADIGISDPEGHLAKVKLTIQINLLIEKKKLNQKEAAKLLGIDQSGISALHKGRLTEFSLDKLFRFLNILGQDIDIKITPKARTKKKPDINVSISKVTKKPVRNSAMAPRSAMLARKNK